MVLRADTPPSGTTLAVAATLVAANVALFVLIAEDLLAGGGLISHDDAVLTWFVDHRTDRLISVAKLVSVFGGFVPLSIAAALIGFWLWRRGWHLGVVAAPLTALVLASLTSTAAKAMFDRSRPPVTVHATTVTLAAFPSGHATDAAAFFLAASLTLAITIARRRSAQLWLLAAGLVLTAAVGLSRLVLGVHWLSDVVAGWALGAAFAIAVVVIAWQVTTNPSSGRRSPAPSEPA